MAQPACLFSFSRDSAGTNLCMSASLALKQQGVPVPAAIAAFSAWPDMRTSGESYERIRYKDAMGTPEALGGVNAIYLGVEASLEDPHVDLLRTDLTGLPTMYLATGTADILESDAISLTKNARGAGIDMQLELPTDLQHIWVAQAGNLAEADQMLSEAAAFLFGRRWQIEIIVKANTFKSFSVRSYTLSMPC